MWNLKNLALIHKIGTISATMDANLFTIVQRIFSKLRKNVLKCVISKLDNRLKMEYLKKLNILRLLWQKHGRGNFPRFDAEE